MELKSRTYEELVLDLKIISKIKPYEKLYIEDNKISIDNTYYLSFIYRYLYNQTRDLTISYLETLNVDLTLKLNEILTKTCNENNNENIITDNPSNVLVNLSHDLTLCNIGLKNLIISYNNDEYIKSKIEILINNFEIKIRKISDILKINN
jgi:hypothetical protein